MKKNKKILLITGILLFVIMITVFYLNADRKLPEAAHQAYERTGDLLSAGNTPEVGSVGGEWMVIGLARSGRLSNEMAAAYIQNATEYVKGIGSNRLHNAKSTDNSRLILGLTSVGADVTDVGGYNLLTGLADMDFIKKQGNNGPIWALIAFDSGSYEIPSADDPNRTVTRETLIEEIVSQQCDDGGWGLMRNVSDVDMTAMAIQSLAPYHESELVKEAVERGLAFLSEAQNANGSFESWGSETSESCAQVIVALSALGIDPEDDVRFIKNGFSVVDALCGFYVENGGFRHICDGALDGMATEQGYYALAAYFRFLNGKTSLYNMSDVPRKE